MACMVYSFVEESHNFFPQHEVVGFKVFLHINSSTIWNVAWNYSFTSAGADPGGERKATKVTLFTTILYSSENSIRDMRPFCRPLFRHSSVVKYTSALLQ